MVKVPPPRTLRRYGLTADEYRALWANEDGHCYICTKPFTPARPACIDHAHTTGRVRGLLCRPCNWTLGALHEDSDWLLRAHNWLLSPPSVALGIVALHVDAPPQP